MRARRNYLHVQKGQGAIEYAFIVALIALIVILVLTYIGKQARTAICQTGAALAQNEGSIAAWGYGGNGALANGSTTATSTPVGSSSQLCNVVQLYGGASNAGSNYSAIALTADGSVWQIGGTSGTPIPNPKLIGSGATAIAAAQVAVIMLKADGTVWWMGQDTYGVDGSGTAGAPSATFQQVAGISGAIAIWAAGASEFWAQSTTVLAGWGYDAGNQLGTGATADACTCLAPTLVAGLPSNGSTVKTVTGGYRFSVFLTTAGVVYTAGCDYNGDLGDGLDDGLNPCSAKPTTQITSGFTAVSAAGDGPQNGNSSSDHVLALKSDGTVYAWGDNAYGQLGSGDTTTYKTPHQIPSFTNVVSISAGGTGAASSGPADGESLAAKSDGTVWAWGSNDQGQLGTGATDSSAHSTPIQVAGITGALWVSSYTFTGAAVLRPVPGSKPTPTI